MEAIMTLYELENKIFSLEGIRIIIRTKRNNFKDYEYVRKCPDNTSIKDFLDTRINWLLEDEEIAVVINGYGEIPNIRTHIGTVRASYNV